MQVITKITYKCEKCESTYDTAESAESCENSHINCTCDKISNLKYLYKGKYPNTILVLMDDNTTHRYKIEEINY